MSKSISQILNAPVLAPIKKNVYKIKPDFLADSAITVNAFENKKILNSTYDIQNKILNRAANAGNIIALYDIFRKLDKPDLKSYSIMIKGLTVAKDVKGAFAIYEDMKKAGIQANQVVYTSLIKACLGNRQIHRAWKIWDFLRSHISEPDYKSYSLMIHACTYTGEVEKALGLFEEMKEKGLEITPATICSLIQVCGARKDYYLESFNLFDQLKEKIVKPNLYTYNTLLSVTSREGDYKRGLLIWDELTKNDEMELNEYSFSMILKTLARGLSKLRNDLKKSEEPLQNMESKASISSVYTIQEANDVNLKTKVDDMHTEDKVAEHLNIVQDDISVGDSHHAKDGMSSASNILEAPQSPSHEISTIYEKSVEIWEILNKDYPSLVNNHILDAYLKVLCSVPASKEGFDRALTFFREKYSTCIESSKGQGYLSLLAYSIKNPDVFKEYAPTLWKEYLEWDNAQESRLVVQGLTETEKEEVRVTEYRDRDSIFTAFIWMVRGYTRAGDTEQALEILKNSQEFRSLDYLRPVFFKDIWILVKRARDQSEDGKWILAQELSQICSYKNIDPLQAVQKSMKQKLMPNNWWGWKAVGLDEVELKRLQKRNKRIKTRVQQMVNSKKKNNKTKK